MQERLDALQGEPWNRTPKQIRAMTDAQIDAMFAYNRRQQKELEDRDKPKPSPAVTKMEKRAEEGEPPSFEALWAGMYSLVPWYTRELARAHYDEQLASYLKERESDKKGK